MQAIARAKSIVHASPMQVYDAFANPESMGHFWFHRKDQGLKTSESVTFYLGDGDDAFGFSVEVQELQPGSLIHIKWGDDDGWTEVRWLLEETGAGETILTIEESGFTGTDAEIMARIIDSTKGFNQVIIAAKAFLEHGVAINVVSDHA